MYSREENWFQNALSKSSAEEYKSKGIPKTVWSQSWGCFLSVLASMVVSHQHRLRKRLISSGKCNYQRANPPSMLPINYFSSVRSEINHFLPMRACHIWQCYLTVYSFERMRCATSKESTIQCMRMQLPINTHQHCCFISPWLSGNFSLVSSLE